MANTAPSLSKTTKRAGTQVRRGASASDVAESLTQGIKSAALTELSKQKAQSLQKLIRQEEAKLTEAIAKSFEEKNEEKADRLSLYYEELTNYYYSASTKTAKELKSDILPLFDDLIADINNDSLLSKEEKVPLLDIVKKTTETFNKRLTLQSRLTESSKKILGSAARKGAERSGVGLLVLATFDIYKKRKESKQEKQEVAENAKREARIRRQTRGGGQGSRQTPPNVAQPAPTTPRIVTSPMSEVEPQASATQVASSSETPALKDDVMDIPKTVRVKPYTRKDGTEVAAHSRRKPYEAQLVGVLTQHSKILGSILEISGGIKETLITHSKNLENIDIATSKQYELFQKKFAKEEMASEEGQFEDNVLKKQLATKVSEKNADARKTGGLLNSLGGLIPGFTTALGVVQGLRGLARFLGMGSAAGIGTVLLTVLTTGAYVAMLSALLAKWGEAWGLRKKYQDEGQQRLAKKEIEDLTKQGVDMSYVSPAASTGEQAQAIANKYLELNKITDEEKEQFKKFGGVLPEKGQGFTEENALTYLRAKEFLRVQKATGQTGAKAAIAGAIFGPQLRAEEDRKRKLEEEAQRKRDREEADRVGQILAMGEAGEIAPLRQPAMTPGVGLEGGGLPLDQDSIIAEAERAWRVNEAQQRINEAQQTKARTTASKVSEKASPVNKDLLQASQNIAARLKEKLGVSIDPNAIYAQAMQETAGGKKTAGKLNFLNVMATSAQLKEGKATIRQVEERLTPERIKQLQKSQPERDVKVITDAKFIDKKYGKGAFEQAQKQGLQWVSMKSGFADYASMKEFEDATVALLSGQRYGKALQTEAGPGGRVLSAEDYARTIGKAGFATADAESYGRHIAMQASALQDSTQKGRQELTSTLQASRNPMGGPQQPMVINNVYNDNRVSSANVKKDAGLDTRNHDNTLRRSLGG